MNSRSCLAGETIKVYVGPETKCYSVHKALLAQCKWFHNKIYDLADETVGRDQLELPAEDPKVFELLMTWLYRKNLEAHYIDERAAEEDNGLYICLYFRACVWEMQDLQNALMDRLKCRLGDIDDIFLPECVASIYENTDLQSPLRSCLVDSFIYEGIEWTEDGDPTLSRKAALKRQLDAGNQAFVLDCYEALFKLCKRSRIRHPERKTGCVYHRHEDGKMCRD